MSVRNPVRACLRLFVVLAILAGGARSVEAADGPPVQVFLLVGQSNMQGQAVADLEGPDYNGGRGTLDALLRDPARAAMARHLKAADGTWAVRNDVRVSYQPEEQPLKTGPLTLGFTGYGGRHHFGPELEFGHRVGDALAAPVLLIKTAWGGKSLYVDFRPPSAGGEVGPYYTKMLAEIRAALAKVGDDFPGSGGKYELAGLVWYQGWNDGCDPKNAVPEYERNLVHLIGDLRRDLGTPDLPVVIGELTGAWVDAPPEWEQLRKAQADAAAHAELGSRVRFVPTRDFVRKPEDSPCPGHGHHEFANAETYLLVGDALGRAMVELIDPKAPVPPKQAFEVEGRPAFVIQPDRPAAGPMPWVWYAPTFPDLPEAREHWMFERFLAAGIAVAGVDVGESYGSPEGRRVYSALYDELVKRRGFSPRPVLLARSRGGLMLYNWAAEHPGQVAGIAGIYPVCDLRSYPGLDRACGAYGLTADALAAQLDANNPVARLAPLAGAGVPIFHIHGDVDTVVPLEANSGAVAEAYQKLGGTMTLRVPPGQGHNLWEGFFQCGELVDFVRTRAAAQR